MSTTIGIGSVKPGPKPFVSRSYALRVVWSFGAVPASARPSRTASTGEASSSRTTITTGSTIFALRETKRPQAAIGVRCCPSRDSSTGRMPEPAAVDLRAEQRQDGGQQRVGEQHRGQDAERAADAELRDEVEPDQRQPGDRDRHGHAREDHRAPGRRSRGGRSVLRRQPVVQELSETGDDEQRVVDARRRARSSAPGSR